MMSSVARGLGSGTSRDRDGAGCKKTNSPESEYKTPEARLVSFPASCVVGKNLWVTEGINADVRPLTNCLTEVARLHSPTGLYDDIFSGFAFCKNSLTTVMWA